jgi:hypothetical protein
MADRSDLDQMLDQGAMDELPPNIAPGFMGEKAPDMRKEESFEPSFNAGLIQEHTWETRWLTIGLLYVVIITAPVAAWLVWRDPKRSLRVKIIATVVGLAGYAVIYWAYGPGLTR